MFYLCWCQTQLVFGCSNLTFDWLTDWIIIYCCSNVVNHSSLVYFCHLTSWIDWLFLLMVKFTFSLTCWLFKIVVFFVFDWLTDWLTDWLKANFAWLICWAITAFDLFCIVDMLFWATELSFVLFKVRDTLCLFCIAWLTGYVQICLFDWHFATFFLQFNYSNNCVA